MKKAVLFDLDGTLWDSSTEVTDSWNDCLCNQTECTERITTDDMHRFMGKTMDVIAAMMLPSLPKAEQLRIMDLCMAHENQYLKTHPGKIYPAVQAVLTELKKEYVLGIVSNCQDGYIQVFLEQCGFSELFDDYESAGKTGMQKGDNIRLVMERNHIGECIYVGDTQGDADAAKYAGIPFLHAAYGFGQPDACDGAIQSFSELTEAVEKLFHHNS